MSPLSDTAGMSDKPTCFIAMPISVPDHHFEVYHDRSHWRNIMEHLFIPAIEAAGFRAVPPITTGAYMIHAQIVKHLETSDLVLCDSSQHNPNVTFELGVRVAVDRPMCLVKDDRTKDLPFDTSGINTHTYTSLLAPWNLEAELEALAEHIRESEASCAGSNPMWQRYGLQMRARQPVSDQDPRDARIDLLLDQVREIRTSIAPEAQTTVGDVREFWEKWGPIERTLRSLGDQRAEFETELKQIMAEANLHFDYTSPGIGRLTLITFDPFTEETALGVRELGERYYLQVSIEHNPQLSAMI
jgi:hypothetical protein